MPKEPASRPSAPTSSLLNQGPKVSLILAAEVLFARDGIEGASLREIASHAGQRNHHAVQYHFGSRDSLAQAVFDYRMNQMEEMRGLMLAKAEAEGKLGDLRTIVEVIFLPQIQLIDAFGDHSYAAFLTAYLQRYQAQQFGQFGDHVAPQLARTLALLRSYLDSLGEAAAQRRLITACFMFLNILVIHTRDNGNHEERFEDAVEDTIGQIVAAFAAPVKTSTEMAA